MSGTCTPQALDYTADTCTRAGLPARIEPALRSGVGGGVVVNLISDTFLLVPHHHGVHVAVRHGGADAQPFGQGTYPTPPRAVGAILDYLDGLL